jgi:hypothetical protein
MPLSPPAPRKLIHTRAIQCTGYEREDGLWDIEAHLTDTKTGVHTRHHGGRERQPGEPVHDLWIRLTIDLDLTIGPGWRRGIAERVGGVKGCTHLVELLGPLGTTAFQATNRARQARSSGQPVTKKPYQLNSCHVYKDDSPAVLERWPQFYTGPR